MAFAEAAWIDGISPAELVRAAQRSSEVAFLREFGDAPFLAIRVTDDTATVTAVLDATLAGAEMRVARPIAAMGFHTEMASGKELAMLQAGLRRPSPREDGDDALLRAFTEASHYLVPLKKRTDVDAAFSDRISVGRAPNKDIVLRHASISKFHAWFQMDEMSQVYVADAGSKNGTRLDGQRLPARDPVQAKTLAVVAFGSVEGMLVDAEALFRVLHASY
jgi:hypothetical protein